MEQRVREIDTMKGTSHSHGDHKRSHIPSGDANTATFKWPAKNPECGIANTPYLKVVGISIDSDVTRHRYPRFVRNVTLVLRPKTFVRNRLPKIGPNMGI